MDDIRRQAPSERRIRSRLSKLLGREIAHAHSNGRTRIRCPCKIHARGSTSSLTIPSYRRCLQRNGRHPWFFGSTEGFEQDTSNTEWDEHIAWYHGARAAENIRCVPQRTLDRGIGITDMVVGAYDVGDTNFAQTFAEDDDPIPP
ncbi:hypothetical protein M758_UG038500 [Ceratodon purpureus]|nr:hypothetical protein M758_UG038500 [Ceratodon purpureus]